MSTTAVQRVLPRDVYDALELSAGAFGGIGQGEFFSDDDTPCCVWGHAAAITDYREPGFDAVSDALVSADILVHDNDRAVVAINERKDVPPYVRVSFAEWCAELSVVRGEQ